MNEEAILEKPVKTGQVLGYRRVSTVDQHLDRQLEGMEFDRVFEEKVSGKDRYRPALIEMIAYARSGDTIVVHSLDRLCRNVMDLLQIVKGFSERGVTVKFLKEGLTFAPGDHSPMATFQLNIFSAVAQFERELILERQREGIAIARKDVRRYPGRKATLTDEQVFEMIKGIEESGCSVSDVINNLERFRITRKDGMLVTKISRQSFNMLRASYVRRHPEIAKRWTRLKAYLPTEGEKEYGTPE